MVEERTLETLIARQAAHEFLLEMLYVQVMDWMGEHELSSMRERIVTWAEALVNSPEDGSKDDLRQLNAETVEIAKNFFSKVSDHQSRP